LGKNEDDKGDQERSENRRRLPHYRNFTSVLKASSVLYTIGQ
jgi:hypothetical protein